MSDLLQKQGKGIHCDRLLDLLGIPIIETSAIKHIGLDQLITSAKHHIKNGHMTFQFQEFSSQIEVAISEIQDAMKFEKPDRFTCIKLLENDPIVLSFSEITIQ